MEPMVLRDLTRHASVITTEKYDMGITAKKTRQHLRAAKSRSEVTLDQNQPASKQLASKKAKPPVRLELTT